MKRRMIWSLAALTALVLAAVLIIASIPREVSLILLNGTVYTVNDEMPVAEAVALLGDRIAAVGPTREILDRFRASRVVDLQGKPVYPGFIDSHAHMENLGIVLMTLNLSDTRSAEEVCERVAARARELPGGDWIRGRGWDQNRWPGAVFPTRADLDAAVNNRPVYLTRVDGHAVWVNSRALELVGISAATADPPGGRILRDESGNPTGVFIDRAIDLLDEHLPPPTVEERTRAVELAVRECLRVGLTEIHDMGVDREGIAIYKRLIAEGRFPFRIYAAIDGAGSTWEEYLKSGPEIARSGEKLTVRALKLYADGALGSRGAALIEPYSDDPPNRGLTLITSQELLRVARQAAENSFQVCVHAIGDRANHIVLDVYEELGKVLQEKRLLQRFRVEHAQVLAPEDIARFKQLGVIPAMQPVHCTSDMAWAWQRLGPERVKSAYAWRSLLDSGTILPGGSDFPVESPNPLWGFYAAVTRQDRDGSPQAGWYPEQCMTREEALKSFTIWAAYGAFREHLKGSIEEGKLADLVVLSSDIMKIPASEIPATTVSMTILGGEVVYAADAIAHE